MSYISDTSKVTLAVDLTNATGFQYDKTTKRLTVMYVNYSHVFDNAEYIIAEILQHFRNKKAATKIITISHHVVLGIKFAAAETVLDLETLVTCFKDNLGNEKNYYVSFVLKDGKTNNLRFMTENLRDLAFDQIISAHHRYLEKN